LPGSVYSGKDSLRSSVQAFGAREGQRKSLKETKTLAARTQTEGWEGGKTEELPTLMIEVLVAGFLLGHCRRKGKGAGWGEYVGEESWEECSRFLVTLGGLRPGVMSARAIPAKSQSQALVRGWNHFWSIRPQCGEHRRELFRTKNQKEGKTWVVSIE